MPPFPNLISESTLVTHTIQYLQAVGGKATAVRIVDRVMKIRRPDPGFALMLVSDLVERDKRLSICEDVVEFVDCGHDHIKLSDAEFVVLDLETTGAKAPPSRITEIGAYRVRNGEVTDSFHSLVNPEMPIPAFIISLTGISDAMVAGAPKFAEVADAVLNFIGESVLVAHNARFDLGFLNYEIGRIYEDCRLGNPSLCTVQLSRGLISEIENHKLKTVANYYSISLENHHRAADDAHATAKIFVNLLSELKMIGVSNLGAARQLSRKKRYAEPNAAAA
ncbi:MAG: PolC-type DNA polymerase III [Pyrinomonadaceae bacterium]